MNFLEMQNLTIPTEKNLFTSEFVLIIMLDTGILIMMSDLGSICTLNLKHLYPFITYRVLRFLIVR